MRRGVSGSGDSGFGVCVSVQWDSGEVGRVEWDGVLTKVAFLVGR